MEKYIPNTHNLPVGYGYRLLSPEEYTIKGDEFWYIHGRCWKLLYPSCEGKRLIDWPDEMGIRRKINVGEDYELVPENELVYASKRDEWITYHYPLLPHGWQLTTAEGKTTENALGNFQLLSIYGAAYRRRKACGFKIGEYVVYDSIINAPGQFTKGKVYIVREYPTQWGSLGVQIDDSGSKENGCSKENFRKATQEEIKNYLFEQSQKEIKVGDYITAIDKSGGETIQVGDVYELLDIYDGVYRFYNKINKKEDGWELQHFRKSTREEIEKYLLNEANKQGFVIGAKINSRVCGQGTIKELRVIFAEDFIGDWGSCVIIGEQSEYKSPFMAVKYSFDYWPSVHVSPLKHLTLYKEVPFHWVSDDGVVRYAQFFSGYVEYTDRGNLIRISNQQIRDALRLLNSFYSNSNTPIEVGFNGLQFYKELIEKFVTKLIG